MMKRIFFFICILSSLLSCSDDDSFTTDPSARLTFSTDTVRMDTVFTTIGSSTYSFWAFNYSGDGIRISRVFLRKGSQNGFRVNVDGSFLDNSIGSSVSDLEVRKGDSIRVFVELTAPVNMQDVAQKIEDDLVFQLESGVEQDMHLTSYAWDAQLLRNPVIQNDTVIESTRPILIYGQLKVNEGVTLTIKNTTLFFHDKAGMSIYGTLLTESVLMRGDRLDHMFDYLPYDRVSGQWGGLRFYESSTGNILINTVIRSGTNAVRCDSSQLSPDNQRLYMERCVVHNSMGYGVQLRNSYVSLVDCQVSNSEGDCVSIYGGAVNLSGCTIAQFYPFVANHGVALRFTNALNGYQYPLEQLDCRNSIITGYADDEIMGTQADEDANFNYWFENSLLRTPKIDDEEHFKDIIWETPADIIQGKLHFVNIDETNFIYDFHLVKASPAQGLGCYRQSDSDESPSENDE